MEAEPLSFSAIAFMQITEDLLYVPCLEFLLIIRSEQIVEKMGKIVEFNVVLHGNRLVYYPGEQIFGEVILNLNEPMEMRGLRIECEGMIKKKQTSFYSYIYSVKCKERHK